MISGIAPPGGSGRPQNRIKVRNTQAGASRMI
jgi:hypothetical protein